MRAFTRFAVALAFSSAVACSGGDGTTDNLGGDPNADGGDLDGTSGDGSGTGDETDTGGFILPDTGTSCVKKTCTELGTNCGPVADGCGGLLDCGTCTAPEFCGGGGKASTCGTAPCTKKTCTELDATCGMQGDGCGGLIDCGTCTAPDTCGGGGTANHCGTSTPPDSGTTCTAKTCTDMSINCGFAANGCGGLVDCGSCAAGTGSCGGGGVPNVCGSSTSPCLKKTCADWGANCGPVSDGCGGLTASCGTCTGGNFCGGGGPSLCGGAPAACTKKTCADFPGTCGPQPDGCGGLTVDCGACTPPQTCGGGGVPSVCGGTAACVKKTCADYPAGTCGQVSDGCGGLTVDCGTCSGGNTCGGGGVPSVCGGAPTCTKKTCADYPAGTCGMVSDGCGGLTADCGSCTSPAICGGGGVASKCGGGGTSTTCVNLACKQVVCTPTTDTTSISGTVYDPAGLRPLPNVFVYVPNAAVGTLPSGASCDKCSAALSGSPLVTTTTDVNGKFKLDNMPVDTNVPVVIQIGKWRRQITVTTSKCVDTVVPAAKSRLPRNKSEGDIPKIALTTGAADPLECLLRKIGIDDAEFTNPTGTGRVNLFKGYDPGAAFVPPTNNYSAALGGASFPNATQLWNTVDPSGSTYGLRAYDVVMLGCEGQDTTSNKSAAALKAMQDYVNAGGRVFGEHYHYTWMRSGVAPWPGMVSWNTTLVTLASPTQETVLTTLLPSTTTPFPKGVMMSQWMKIVGAASAATPSLFPVNGGRNSINSITDTTNVLQWIQVPAKTAGSGKHPAYPQYFSFNTPVGAAPDAVCGRFVFSDIHVSSGDSVGKAFPTGCTTTTMTPQELALEFMFFDLSSRVCDETVPPPPPTCTKLTCADQGISCGAAPDGCGGSIASCGTCVAPLVCSTGGKCAGSSCTPTDCTKLGYSCGSWPDGCGSSVNCGTCAAPATCGGGGVTGKCGGTTCTKTTCTALGYDCGTFPDGCGGTLDCGTCVAPMTCGGSGATGKCGGTTCTKNTCTALGYDCGSWPDGCGGSLSCGTCVAPKTCGGGGTTGKCGDTTSCTKKTCAELGITCGLSGDGCGGTQDCGTCPTPDAGSGCTPLTCGGRCGPQGDGCGGILTCPACDGGTCIPTTCAKAGADCGNYPDGCGGLLNCGTCTAPATCGGGGVANKCGGIK